jgi:rhodanese-related sulfurtransferase
MPLKRVFSVLFFALLCLGILPANGGETPYTIIGPEELKGLVDSGADTFVVIDARNPEEYQEVHIPGAINVPQKKFDKYKNLLPADKNKLLIFYCNGVKCGKSKKAAKQAVDEGYTHIKVFAQGMPVWEEMNYPIKAGPDYEKKIETTKVSPSELQAMIEGGMNDFTVVDVRDPAEYGAGHIPGAINIPVATFASQSGQLDKKKQIIVYCNSGNRSYLGYRKLQKLSYKKIYQALFADWQAAGMVVVSGTVL